MIDRGASCKLGAPAILGWRIRAPSSRGVAPSPDRAGPLAAVRGPAGFQQRFGERSPIREHGIRGSLLRCGILAHGFLHVRCEIAPNRLVAFSCKRRGFCPSCIGRRMNENSPRPGRPRLAAVPIRQSVVLTVPHGLRYAMAHDPVLTGAVLPRVSGGGLVVDAQSEPANRAFAVSSRPAQITVIQRFDSALALNVHFHSLLIDGVDTRMGRPAQFHPVAASSDEDVAVVAARGLPARGPANR